MLEFVRNCHGTPIIFGGFGGVKRSLGWWLDILSCWEKFFFIFCSQSCCMIRLYVIQWKPCKVDTIGEKKMCPLYRDVCFIEIFSKMVWPQSKAIRSSSSSSSEHFNILFCTSLDFMKVIKDFVKYGKVLQRLLKNISGSSFYLSFFFSW